MTSHSLTSVLGATMLLCTAGAFVVRPTASSLQRRHYHSLHARSRVVDEDGPTPPPPYTEPKVIDTDSIPELTYDENAHPIPHQPWRRGMTMGCEDPIEADWRREAEHLIKTAAKVVGGKVLDVTWFLTECVVTVDDTSLDEVDEYSIGPDVVVEFPRDGPMYFDPDDPNPEPIWADDEEEEMEPEAEEEMEEQKRKQEREKLFAKRANQDINEDDEDEDEFDNDDDDDVPMFMTKEEQREEEMFLSDEELVRRQDQPREFDNRALTVNTKALSTMAHAILGALEREDDELLVLERHEVVLASPEEDPTVLDTQSRFDAHRDKEVWVETHDPWGSNRTLRGKLVDRNSMDVIINKRGRMVTIPHTFVKCVRLPPTEEMEDEEEYEYEEY